jgi:uncharacterized protein (TIGR02118 family)
VIKVYVLLRKSPRVSEAYFHEHWRTVHAGHALRIGSLRRYTQSHRLSHPVLGLPAAEFDGVAEIWVDDIAALLAQRDDPDYTEYAMKDEPTFIDVGALASLPTDGERQLVPGARHEPSSAKLMVFTLGGSQDADDEVTRVIQGFGDSVLWATARTVVQEMSGPTAMTGYTGLIEVAWPTPSGFDSSWAEYGQRFADELRSVAGLGPSSALLVEELRFIWPDAADDRGSGLHAGTPD